MRKYPMTFMVIGLILMGIGFQLPTNTPHLYWLSIIFCGVGGFLFGFSLRHINKEDK